MDISRRKFVKLSSVALAGLPLLPYPEINSWYKADQSATEVEDAEELFNLFKNPGNTARPFVRWWWNGNRVVKEEILRELDLLKAAGIGGVEINSVAFPNIADPMHYKAMDWLSNEWIEMLQVALQGAKERELICDIIVGSGWPFGGEYLSKEEQTQILALGTRQVTGPLTLQIKRQEILDSVEPPITFKHTPKYKELTYLRLAPAQLQNIKEGLDLNKEINKETITINIPAGEHVLYSLVKLTGFMAVINGTPGGSGPVLNHYSKPAVERYLNRMSSALMPKLGVLGNHFRSFFVDSLELEGANWCDDMYAEFQKRRGYKLQQYIPYILFKTGHMGFPLKQEYGSKFSPELQDTINRVRYDFEITKIELFRERFLQTFTDWCLKNKVKSRIQAYGREFHPSDTSMLVDIPECETWLRPLTGEDMAENDFMKNRGYAGVSKFVSSGARLAGKKLVSCEEVTNVHLVFNATLERMKITGDQSNLSGVTHSILHGFNYSPPDAPFPGWIRYGTFFNERNPWWPYVRKWIDYKTRLSAVFQNGELQSNIAVMHPLADLWSKHGVPWDPFPEVAHPAYVHNVWEAIHQNGSGCDYLSEQVIQAATFNNGQITYGTRNYKVLLLIEVETMQPETAMALKRYAEAGGQIVFIGQEPKYASGYTKQAKTNKKVAETIQNIKQQYPEKVVTTPAPQAGGKILDWYREVQQKYNIQPYVKLDTPSSSVSQVYYKAGNLDIFFIANYHLRNSYNLIADFNIAGKTAWLWNPETGERFLYPTTRKANKLNIKLEPAKSQLIVFDKKSKGERLALLDVDRTANPVTGSWTLSLNHTNGTRKTMTLNQLVDFKDSEELKAFAGVATYENSFNVAKPKAIKYLDLGKVFGVSEVTINSKSVGVQWHGNHVYDISEAVKKGSNTVSIKLTTTLGNYMKSIPENVESKFWMKNQGLYSLGVIGPVRIL